MALHSAGSLAAFDWVVKVTPIGDGCRFEAMLGTLLR
jgi:hypothetical protein